MDTVAINTTQNTAIDYEMAGFKDRLLAFIVDSLILWGSVLILSLCAAFALREYYNYGFFLVILPLFLFYTIVSEILYDGRTIGKKAMNIKVVKLTGKELSLSDHVIRWIFRIIDIWFSLGSVAALLISSSEKNQRLGDILGNTAVIRVKPTVRLRLSDILTIYSKENYQPKYPEAARFTEEDMLLIKNALDQIQRYYNDAHREALDLLIKKIGEMLGTPMPKGEDKINYVKTLIRDYIVLTR